MTFEEKYKDFIAIGSFEELHAKGNRPFAGLGLDKEQYWHRSRGMSNILNEIESIIEDCTYTDYQWNGEDEYPVDVLNKDHAAKQILKYLIKSKLLK